MDISIIVSAYRRPRFLELVLRGYALQTDPRFEVVVADDGSGPELLEVIERARAETAMELVHVWHEDRGFRKTTILNRSIVAARGDYLLFTDADCIPRRDLVEVHRALARPDHFVAGGYLKLSPEVTEQIGPADVDDGRITDLRWLRERGWRPGRRALRLIRSRRLAALFDRLTPTPAVFQGNNAAAWRDHLQRVNGFEGDMGYGGLDRELGYRMENAGIRGIQARHRAVVMHLHHDRPYRDEAAVRANRRLLDSIRRQGDIRARNGLDELGPDATLRIDRVAKREK
jgi:glycosyltransferase involved in cell wall biosynthesis